MCFLVMNSKGQLSDRLKAMFRVNGVYPVDTCTCTIIELTGRGDMSSILYQGPVHLGYVLEQWDHFCPVHGATPEEFRSMMKWSRCEQFQVPVSNMFKGYL